VSIVSNLRIAVEACDRLGESALWHNSTGSLFWIDLLKPRLHRIDLLSGQHVTLALSLSAPLGAIVQTDDPKYLLVSHRHGLSFLNINTGATTIFADPESDRDAISYNDCKVDRFGGLWVGTSHLPETEPRGALWRVNGKGGSRLCDAGFVVCNGPAFSPDGRVLYFSDTFGRQIFAYDLDPTDGKPRNRRIFATFANSEGYPDGLTVDSSGALWAAHWNGGCVTRFAPNGTRMETLTIPAPNVTSIAFAGPELRNAFVTTARDGLDEATLAQFPLAGSLFQFDSTVAGLPEPLFVVER
jgi:xylono-1,5-lactonase